MFVKKIFIFAYISIIACCSLLADYNESSNTLDIDSDNHLDFQSMFNRASRLYSEDKKDEALEIYSAILTSGVQSGDVYYNIGNIYMERESYAEAIVYYERALRAFGYDKDLLNNLKLAYKNVGGDDFYQAYSVKYFHLFFYLYKISIVFILIMTIVIFCVILFLFILKLKIGFLKNLNAKKFLMAYFSIFVLLFVANFCSNYMLSQNFLIIQNNEAYIREGASENSKNIYNLSLGEKMPIIESHENWYYVKIDFGRYGWIMATDGISIF